MFSLASCGFIREGCWFGAENKIRDAELAKVKSDTRLAKVKTESELILKSKRTTVSERKVLTAGVVTNTSISSTDFEDLLFSHVSASCVTFPYYF